MAFIDTKKVAFENEMALNCPRGLGGVLRWIREKGEEEALLLLQSAGQREKEAAAEEAISPPPYSGWRHGSPGQGEQPRGGGERSALYSHCHSG
ncbi:hypothetical protein Phum_PHUM202240 [Pediculus humanus corporis]|uniref:Uncharacterized protein n=1 Tax=Pediculus humanus subsp. corporis TaxID=121224 RepID=E0VH65_PEDHC|nr:uncharacterized protein Phum_PHUM202240 [Pediculus humanus corporis]EEB12721.1 hypothetical protein Phum_PHUM202240 [Pediculus humanus corporis]